MKSIHILSIFILVLLHSCNSTSFVKNSVETDMKQFNYVFKSGAEGYKCFRIPAIVKTVKGDLLAFAEGRKKGCSDTGDIDLVMKRSKDNGLTWSALQVVWSDEENTCGNPAPVLDETTGNIFLLSTRNLGTDHEREIIDLKSEDTRRIFILSSSDEGHNWSEPIEITKNVKEDNWTWYATGPGSGIQLKYGRTKGRMIIACDHIEAENKKYFSHIIFSDDFGKSWKLGGTTPQDMVNECEIAELSDGHLMLNMRNYNRDNKARRTSFSKDGGMTWSNIEFDNTLIEPICQASLHRHSFSSKGKGILLFSNPASNNSRTNMTVRASFDDGKTWAKSLVLHKGPSAYSDLVSINNKNFGCLFEGGKASPYEGIVFESLNIKGLK